MNTFVRSLIATLSLCCGCAHASAPSASADDPRLATQHEADCGPMEIERHFAHDERGLQTRVVDRRICGVTKLRVVDTIDPHERTHTREVLRDRNLDGSFEHRHVRVRPLTESFANHLRDQAVPELDASNLPVGDLASPPSRSPHS